MANRSAKYWRDRLQLIAHIEGGAFLEIYRAPLILPESALTPAHGGNRNAMTSIYFLLEEGDFSAFHRIASDELWHHYDGDSLCIYEITDGGSLLKHVLGKGEGETPFVAIKAGSWFGSRVESPGSYCLCGCTVAPGFDFADFELADREWLSAAWPAHAGIISALTRI